MAFKVTKYESDAGDIHPIRINTTTESAAGTPPSGDVDNDIRVKITKTNREYGLRPRYVVVARTVGTAPNQFKRYRKIPMLTQTAWDDFAVPISLGTVTYDELTSKEPEDF